MPVPLADPYQDSTGEGLMMMLDHSVAGHWYACLAVRRLAMHRRQLPDGWRQLGGLKAIPLWAINL
jgi:hypothetical protein